MVVVQSPVVPCFGWFCSEVNRVERNGKSSRGVERGWTASWTPPSHCCCCCTNNNTSFNRGDDSSITSYSVQTRTTPLDRPVLVHPLHPLVPPLAIPPYVPQSRPPPQPLHLTNALDPHSTHSHPPTHFPSSILLPKTRPSNSLASLLSSRLGLPQRCKLFGARY